MANGEAEKRKINKKSVIQLKNHPDVYSPREDTDLMIQAIQHISKDESLIDRQISILEMGTGSGILSIYLLKTFKIDKLIVTDISPIVAEIAAENISNNLLHTPQGTNIVVMDLFNGFQKQPLFDLIMFNPPYVPTAQGELSRGGIFHSWAGGRQGRKIILAFLEDCPLFLKPKGQILLLISSLNNLTEIQKFASEKCSLRSKIIVAKSVGYEKLYVLKLFF
ncbi:MAG: HemK2/MTQ2 family protein methyltransferase [Candidatus Hermodarchaeota archaeon]